MNAILQRSFVAVLLACCLLQFRAAVAQSDPNCGGGVVLKTQAQVDAFRCTQVRNLTLIKNSNSSDPITDLSSLSSLTTIEQKLDLGSFNAKDVVGGLGLKNLTSIGGDFIFGSHTFKGLERLRRIGGNLSITQESSNDNFEGLEQLETIGGSLSAHLSSFKNFQGLRSLKTIGGSLSIRASLEGLTFQGLSALKSVEGGFKFYGSNITNFSGLTSLLPTIPSIYVEESGIKSFEGLENVTEITGNITLQDAGVGSWNGLDNLRRLGGDITVFNSGTADFIGLESLEAIGGNIEISEGASFTNFAGLTGLRSVKNIFLLDIQGVESLDGINQLSVDGNLNINGTSIKDISALENVEVITGDLVLFDNPGLFTCCVVSSLTDRVQGSILLKYNAPGCNSLSEVEESCPIICGNDIVLRTQTQVDAFDCTQARSLKLIKDSNSSDPITDLSSLSSLTTIEQKLDLGSFNAKDVVGGLGLKNLTSIGGDFIFGSHTFKGLERLRRIGGNLSITQESSNDNFEGLEQLETIGGSLSAHLSSFKNFQGLRSLKTIGGYLFLRSAGRFTFEGLSSLESLGGFALLGSSLTNFSGLPSLQKLGAIYVEESGIDSFEGLENITEISGSIAFQDAVLGSWKGLNNLQRIGGDIEFYRSKAPNFVGLEKLEEIEGRFSLQEGGVASLTGLQRLRSVGSVDIQAQPLASLDGLQQLRVVEGAFDIYETNIVDLNALENIESIESLVLSENSKLAGCCILLSIREKVKDTIEIRYNAPGCNSFEEITSRCEGPENGVFFTYYELDKSWDWVKMPYFPTQEVSKTGNTPNFSLSPAERPDYFGFVQSTYLNITRAGEYTFYVNSDDGSRLVVDNKQVVDNDGRHAAREVSGAIQLSPGRHHLRVEYFQAKGSALLEVRYAGPGIPKQLIPDNVLFTNNAPSASTNVWLEAECASRLGSDWQTTNDPKASGNSYLKVKAGKRSMQSAPTNPDSQIDFSFSVSQAGQYTLFTRHLSYNGDDDSFWVRINGGAWIQAYLGANRGSFTWASLGVEATYPLRAGSNTITIALREPDARLDKLFVTLNGNAPSDKGEAASNCNAPPASTNVWLEAECASRLGSDWQTTNDPKASGNSYLKVKAGKRSMQSAPTNPDSQIDFSFSVSQAGQYTLFTRHLSYNGDDDSFWVRINGGAWIQAYLGANRGSFTWASLGVEATYPLRAGSNTITIALREPDARLDKLFVTLNGNAPSDKGEAASNCSNNARTADERVAKSGADLPTPEVSVLTYPNPVNDKLMIRLGKTPDRNPQSGVLLLTDLSGKVVRRLVPTAVPDGHPLEIDTRSLPAGMYLLRWQADQRYTTKVLVDH